MVSFVNEMPKERIIVIEDGADLLRDAVVREGVHFIALDMVPWRGTGPARGDWEECQLPVFYIPPGRN